MTSNYIKKAMVGLLVAVMVFATPSCKKFKEFGDRNQDPNSPTKPITSALLTNVLAGLGNYAWDQGGINTIEGLYAQYFSETQYTEASRYQKPTNNWDGYYAGPLYDLQTIINYNTAPETAEIAAANGSNANQIATARVLKAYIFWFLTNTYGDIPYFGALKGDNGVVAYDPQEKIYADLFKELTEAVAQFDNGAPVKGDIFLSGDISSWKKFANSIRLLMALNISNVDAANGATQVKAALASDGGVFENGESAALTYPGGVFLNPFYQYYNVTQRKDYAVAQSIGDVLKSYNDPRVNAFGSSTTTFPYGLTRDDAVGFANSNTNWARLINPSLRTSTSPLIIISSSEVTLARAEAAQRGWTTENAAALYMAGIMENWKQWGVYNAANFATYVAQSSVSLSSGSSLQKIATQEWLASYPNGMFGWTIYRRTGYPALSPAPGTNLAIPRRFPYGPNEYNLNPTNVAAAAAQYNVGSDKDSQYGRMWWDK